MPKKIIYAEDAIKALTEVESHYEFEEGHDHLLRWAKNKITALPSAQPEPCEDAVPRTCVEYICRKNTVSTNPYEHKYHDKFIQFMDDPEISDFGRWQHSNGFNTALVAVQCDLDKVPSVQPEVIRCRDCEHYKFADNRAFGFPVKHCEVTGFEDVDDYDFCSRAERRQDGQNN